MKEKPFQKIRIFCLFILLLTVSAFFSPHTYAEQTDNASLTYTPVVNVCSGKCIDKNALYAFAENMNKESSPAQQINQNSSTILSADVLFTMINTYRQQFGLPCFQKDERICQLAKDRSTEIYNEIYITHNMHHGMFARNLPYWNRENIISMNSERAAFIWWIHDPIHRDAIVGNYIYSCIACSDSQCAEEFTNFELK